MSTRVLIRGAGDLTSGTALRLHRYGFDLVMTNIAVPTVVHRVVAFSPTAYEGITVVENTTGILCQNQEEVQEAVRTDRIAVVVDDRGDIRDTWKPEVTMNAVVAKKSLGTATRDIQTVIGMGPGFTAGVDCHCVVKAKRGHNLGRCIRDGSAVPGTGAPGIIGSYDKERIIWTNVDGIFTGCASIEGLVEKGQLVGKVGKAPIYVEVDGMVRGLLQGGVTTCKGMESGDVGPRGVAESCFTVSDKTPAIGGGVLEAMLSHTKLI